MKMNDKKICFIMCANDSFLAEECQLYIEQLKLPDGFEKEVKVVFGAKSMAAGYNEAMRASDAKYKVYLHQDVLLLHRGMLMDVIGLFRKYPKLGMLGVVGNARLAGDGCPWSSGTQDRIGGLYIDLVYTKTYSLFSEIAGDWQEAVVLDGLLMITQYDIAWREDLFQGWDFYDCSQSLEFWKAGWQVGVPHMEKPWCLHDNDILHLQDYEKWRKCFVEEYYDQYYTKWNERICTDADKELLKKDAENCVKDNILHTQEWRNRMEKDYEKDPSVKPVFNLQWYKGEDQYSEGDVEDEVLQIIRENDKSEYAKAICDNFSWSSYYHLINIRQNILNWYPFEKDAEVLEIGCGMGAITETLCDSCAGVTAVELSKRRATAALLRCRDKENLEIIVGNLNDIAFEKKFDYITLIGVLEYQGNYTDTENPYYDFLKKVRSLLKPNGKLLIAIENQYGLKYWCGAREDHTGVPFEGINQYELTNPKVRTFSKQGLEELVKSCGFANTYFYYPMPDYKLPTVVYSQDCLPKNGNMMNMRCYYIPDNRTLVARENEIYDDLIKNHVFEFFANSFLLECSDDVSVGKVTFASLSNRRPEEYQMATRFVENRVVEKYALAGQKGEKHIQEILSNEEALEKRNLNVWRSRHENGKLVTDFCEEMTCEEKLLEYLAVQNKGAILEMFDRLYVQISVSSPAADWQDNILYSFFPELSKDEKKYGTILKTGYLDMILRNAFWIDNDFWWFDQEWILENVPAKYPMYRAMTEFYGSYPQISDLLPLGELAGRYGIDEVWEEMQALEQLFLGAVSDKYNFAAGNQLPSVSNQAVIDTINRIL